MSPINKNPDGKKPARQIQEKPFQKADSYGCLRSAALLERSLRMKEQSKSNGNHEPPSCFEFQESHCYDLNLRAETLAAALEKKGGSPIPHLMGMIQDKGIRYLVRQIHRKCNPQLDQLDDGQVDELIKSSLRRFTMRLPDDVEQSLFRILLSQDSNEQKVASLIELAIEAGAEIDPRFRNEK